MCTVRVTPRAVLLLALLALLAPPLFSDGNDAASWLRSDPRARAYASAQAEILAVFDDAQKTGVPTGPLVDKLKEGVAKRVAADLLVAGLRVELDRLATGESLLAGQAPGLDPGQKEAALRAVSLLLASGASPQMIESLLDAASEAARGSTYIVKTLGVLAQLKLSIHLPDALAQTLGTALLRSRMPQEAFDAIPSVVIRARANGMSSEEVVAIVVGVLRSGGGLIQMQDRLQKASPGAQAERRQERPGAGSAAAHPQAGGPPHPEGPVKR